MHKNVKITAAVPVRIWTLKYEPFMFGGDLHQPVFTMAIPLQTITVSGYVLHVFKNLHVKKYHIAEGTSGALVGHGRTEAEAIAKVTTDISTGSKKVMKKQVSDAIRRGKNAREISQDLFFKCISH